MFIITSKKKGISAISGENDSVEFHNKLFGTDDCEVTFQKDPTEKDIAAMREQEIMLSRHYIDPISDLKEQVAVLASKVAVIEAKLVDLVKS